MNSSNEMSRFAVDGSSDSEADDMPRRNIKKKVNRLIESDSESDSNINDSNKEQIIPETDDDSDDDDGNESGENDDTQAEADRIDAMMERREHRRSTRFTLPKWNDTRSNSDENEDTSDDELANSESDAASSDDEVADSDNEVASRDNEVANSEDENNSDAGAIDSDNKATNGHNEVSESDDEVANSGDEENSVAEVSAIIEQSGNKKSNDSSHTHNDSLVEIVANNNESVVDLDSSDDTHNVPATPKPGEATFGNVSTSTPGASIQPKLASGNRDSPDVFGESTTSTPIESKQLVQPKLSFGNRSKNDSLNVPQLKEELKKYEALYEKFGKSLPDKGGNMIAKIESIKSEIQRKEQEVPTYASIVTLDSDDDVHDSDWKPEPAAKPHTRVQSVNDDWRDAINKIQPKHFGEQGMHTHNQQKTMTINRIAKLHKAMERCPQPDDLARHPDNLKVELMRHQLHALRWMRWRETQKPKGGLLGDDMGLGKTLTMISLVLDTKYSGADAEADESGTTNGDDEDEDDDDDDDEISRVGGKKRHIYEAGTLIVCPASLINQWKHEIEQRVKRNKLAVYVHHTNRKSSPRTVCSFDVVITTYGIVSSEHKCNDVLFKVKWERVVLDEAHQIRNHNTAASMACCALRASVRWALTGTPVQNKHMDVYGMLKFLHVRPFDDLALFKKWIDAKTTDGMKRLHTILKPLLLRRTKAELQITGELQALPMKNVRTELISLSPDEASIYTKFLAYSQTLFTQYMAQNAAKNPGIYDRPIKDVPDEVKRAFNEVRLKLGHDAEVSSSSILVLILRLRQICCHPGLIENMLSEDLENEIGDGNDMDLVKKMVGLNIDGAAEKSDEDESPQSDQAVNVFSKSNKIYDLRTPSSKCNQAVSIIQRIVRESSDKIVVISQWTSVLNIVRTFLDRKGVHYVELNGTTPIQKRNDIVVNFNNTNTPERVILLSLMAGGVGLNLTGANHLLLLDPHWNPQQEAQACDRIYRVGQSKEVFIYRLICDNTIEKHIQGIQEKKLELASNVLTGSCNKTSNKLTIQDMRTLFEM